MTSTTKDNGREIGVGKAKIAVYFFLSLVAFSFSASQCFANDLRITNFAVKSVNTANSTITFKADISWENSWRSAINYDAVWVFMKYSKTSEAPWSHASMKGSGINPPTFSSGSNFEINVPNDEKGFFFYRTDFNTGDVNATNVEFVWDYAQDGLTAQQALAANTTAKIFGIEMVYVPEGAFYAGDGASASDYRFKQGTADNEAWYISGEGPINTTSGASDGFYYTSTGSTGENSSGDLFLIPSSFPKGYGAGFYMKYELTEGQWVSFFNTLTTSEKANRDITSSVEGGKNSDGIVKRNTVSWNASDPNSDASTLRPNRPMSFISWPDLLAYADWAALRPMTELEFEKVSRGKDIVAVANEFAWGKTTSNTAESGEIFPNADEDGEEVIMDSAANINRNSLAWTSGDGRAGAIAEAQAGPVRAGIFAESTTTRSSSGATYYGNMEMSGNLYEMVVTVGRSQGRSFLGSHGDGRLSTISGYVGNATNTDWPGISNIDSARGVDGTVGSGFRGGDFQSPNQRHFQVSTRINAAKDPDSEGHSQRYDAALGIYQGGRLCRTAPAE